MRAKCKILICLTVTLVFLCACSKFKNDCHPQSSIADFLAKDLNDSTEYLLTGEIVSISDYNKGCLYLADDQALVYVYGLCSSEQKSNDQSFASLKLSVGDRLSLVSRLSEHKGRLEAGGERPAQFVESRKGRFDGECLDWPEWSQIEMQTGKNLALSDYPEIPTEDNSSAIRSSGRKILVHRLDNGGRSHVLCWDPQMSMSLWVAYPLYADSIGNGQRSDAWGYDPLLPNDSQPAISEYSYKKGNAGSYIRGHLIPSADRLSLRDNVKTFFVSNAVPQNSSLNAGIWQKLEKAMRMWAQQCDTLFVVSGAVMEGSPGYVKDNNGRRIPVPGGFFKLAAAFSSDKGFLGISAFYCDNRKYDSNSEPFDCETSLQDITAKTGLKFFTGCGNKDSSWFHEHGH